MTWDLSILYESPDDPKIEADLDAAGLRSSSLLPATRLSAEGVAARAPDLPPEGANLIEQLMINAVYATLSRRQVGIITKGVGGNIVFGDQHPQDGMQAIADRLRADSTDAQA